MGGPHLDVSEWLLSLNLSIYFPIFKDYKGVEDLLHLKENDVKALGVRNSAHRATIYSSLVVLYEKFQNYNTLAEDNETLHKEKVSKSRSCPLGEKQQALSLKMEPCIDVEASPEELKKALEWELKLDSRDLRSHAWYHGTIPRPRGEELLQDDGDFLIRDCISQPGDFVLTCYHSKCPLHFVINKVVLQPHTVYERVQHQFEDDSFDTIPDLVTYYVGNKRPISAASGAVISRPINRSMPLSYYASKYGLDQQKIHVTGAINSANFSPRSSPRHSPRNTPKNSPPVGKKLIDSNYPAQTTARQQTSDNVVSKNSAFPGSSNKSKMVRVGSEPLLSPSAERKPFEFRHSGTLNSSEIMQNFQEQRNLDKPPPKPSRIPSMRTTKRPDVTVRRSNSVIDSNKENYPKNANNEALKLSQPNSPVATTCPTLPDKQRQRNPSSESRYSSLRHKRKDSTDSLSLPVKIPITVPSDEVQSIFQLDVYKSFLLPPSGENKPLEMNALLHIKSILLDCGSRVLANNLTQMDLKALKADKSEDLGMGISSGFELLLLPQGYQLRLDILERAECMKLFVAVSILMCGNEEERRLMINKWIQVSNDSKTALGNLYGFYNVMCGLTIPQIERLHSTKLSLRQHHTETAFTFETKLRPTMKSMKDCTNPEAPNTCIPHVVPMAILLDQTFEPDEINKRAKPVLNVPWEEPGIDYGLHLLFRHLDNGRNFVKQINTFKRNSEIVLDKAKHDQAISDMFSTEFQLKFLWGSKGAAVPSEDRYSKFQQVLNVMSNRCENTLDTVQPR